MPIVGLVEFDEGIPSSASTEPREQRGPGGIYHEKQVGALCGLHCVNNLLQEEVYTVEDLRQVAQDLDNCERAIMNGQSLDYGNACFDGFYNVQVIQVVLSQQGLEMVPLKELGKQQGWMRKRSDVAKEKAFILNKHKHWFALRRLGKEWFDLNSCLRAPHHYTGEEMVAHLAEAMGEGYSVFVVRGLFPPCSLEEDRRSLQQAVKECKALKLEELNVEGFLQPPHPKALIFFTQFVGAAQFDSFAPLPRRVPDNFMRRTFRDLRRRKLEWLARKSAATLPGEKRVPQPSPFEHLELQYWPLFIVCQAVLPFLLCLSFYVPGESGPLGREFGLESMLRGRTLLLMHRDCEDLRPEAWRWLSYQLSHESLGDVGAAAALLVPLGLPLEGFFGHLAILTFFNAGILGGAWIHMVLHAHSSGLQGMSPGSYAIVGASLADLLLNWRMRRFGRLKSALIVHLVTLDQAYRWLEARGAKDTHWAETATAQGGGALAGLLLAAFVLPNCLRPRWERALLVLLATCSLALLVFCGVWIVQWPPRSLRYSVPWCWARQVSNIEIFGDATWRCIRCQDKLCIARWTAKSQVNPVDFNACNERYGWSVTER